MLGAGAPPAVPGGVAIVVGALAPAALAGLREEAVVVVQAWGRDRPPVTASLLLARADAVCAVADAAESWPPLRRGTPLVVSGLCVPISGEPCLEPTPFGRRVAVASPPLVDPEAARHVDYVGGDGAGDLARGLVSIADGRLVIVDDASPAAAALVAAGALRVSSTLAAVELGQSLASNRPAVRLLAKRACGVARTPEDVVASWIEAAMVAASERLERVGRR